MPTKIHEMMDIDGFVVIPSDFMKQIASVWLAIVTT